MCRECDDYPQPTPIVEEALAEIIGLNAELRKVRSETEATIAKRKIEYESHVRTLNVIIADKKDEIEVLRQRIVKLTPPLVPRHVAEEMGLRKGVETLIVDNIGEIEQLQRDLQAGTVSESLIRAGVAEASGLLAPKEPDKK